MCNQLQVLFQIKKSFFSSFFPTRKNSRYSISIVKCNQLQVFFQVFFKFFFRLTKTTKLTESTKNYQIDRIGQIDQKKRHPETTLTGQKSPIWYIGSDYCIIARKCRKTPFFKDWLASMANAWFSRFMRDFHAFSKKSDFHALCVIFTPFQKRVIFTLFSRKCSGQKCSTS